MTAGTLDTHIMGGSGTTSSDPLADFFKMLQAGLTGNTGTGSPTAGPNQSTGPTSNDPVSSQVTGGAGTQQTPVVQTPTDMSRLWGTLENNGGLNPSAPPIFRTGDFHWRNDPGFTNEAGNQIGGYTGYQMDTMFGQFGGQDQNNWMLGGTEDKPTFTIKDSSGTGLQYSYTRDPTGKFWVPTGDPTRVQMSNTAYGQDVWVPLIMMATAGLGAYASAGASAADAAAPAVAEGGVAATTPATTAGLGELGSGTVGATGGNLSAGLGTGFAGTGTATGTGVGSVVTGEAAATGAGTVAAGGITGGQIGTGVAGVAGAGSMTNPSSPSGSPGGSSTPSSSGPTDFFKNAGGAYNLFNAITGGGGGGRGGTQTRTGTETTQQQVSPDAYFAIIKDIIENPQTGLSAIMAGQAAAGGYGGSMSSLMTNDLITRAASEIAKLSAPVVKSTDLRGTNGGLTGGGGNPGLTGSNIANDVPALIKLIGQMGSWFGG